MKISVLTNGFVGWGGGIDFLHHVASSIGAASSSSEFEKSLILPKDDFLLFLKKTFYPLREYVYQVKRRESLHWVKRPGFDSSFIENAFSDIDGNFDFIQSGSTYDAQLSAAKKYRADLILPCIQEPGTNDIPWVGYLYDFQHRHLSSFFSQKEIDDRNIQFETMLMSAKHILVNAHTVVDDAQHFYPKSTAKLHALPFSPCPQKEWLENETDVRAKYGLDKQYYIVCNQFWIHKDHPTAFKAFAQFLQAGGDALLVCTGQTSDYRFPGYFDDLARLIRELGISDRVKILGHISKNDQISLLKRAIAVVQPTLFEGGPGGGAAYDAIALGVPLIVSDIAVNLEIDCGDTVFFKTGDHISLSDALLSLETYPRRIVTNEVLWHDGLNRRKKCGDFILNVAKIAAKDC
jgi:glycosyltransferase involved in cell wall biosynthesis